MSTPSLVFVSVLAAAALACGERGERGERPPEFAAGSLQFRVESLPEAYFEGIATVGNRFWINTSAGIVVVDPVAERWTRLYADTVVLRVERMIPCGLRIWLLRADSMILVDPEASTYLTRPTPGGPSIPRRMVLARCGFNGMWTSDGGSLFEVPASQDAAVKHEIPRTPAQETLATIRLTDFAAVAADRVYLLMSANEPNLYLFDPKTSRLLWVAPPPNMWIHGIERAADGVVVHSGGARRFTLRADGQAWAEEQTSQDNVTVLASGDQVVWVGASYDVSPASYFVVRYLRDAMAPKDLVILTNRGYGPSLQPGTAVHHLGMLWWVSGASLLRVDPTANELVRYRLKQTGGELDRRAFSLMKDGSELLYFDEDTVRQFPPPGNEPEEEEEEDAVTDSVPPDSTP